jgi:hypothetical protein
VGSVVVWRGLAYVSPLAPSGALVEVRGEPAVVGSEGGKLLLHVLKSNLTRLIMVLDVGVLGAFYDEGSGRLYVAGSTGTDTLLVEYDVAGERVSVRPLNIGRGLWGVSTKRSVYVLVEGGGLYRVGAVEGPRLVASGVSSVNYPADSVDCFTAVAGGRVVKVCDYPGGPVLKELAVPAELGEVVSADWWGDYVAASTTRGIYVFSEKPLELVVSAPSVVYAGEAFAFKVAGNYSMVVAKIAGMVYSGNGTLEASARLPRGNHTLEVTACRGFFCLVRTMNVLALPRPLRLKALYPAKAAPYEEVELLVQAVDVLANKTVEVACTIRDARGRLEKGFTAGESVRVPALPDITSAVFRITCGGGDYAEESTEVRVALSPPPYAVNLTYRGAGVLAVSAYDKYTREPWRGLIVVTVNEKLLFSDVGSVLVNLTPGTNKLLVELYEGNVLAYSEEVVVVYYEDIWRVPAGEKVVVGDRVVVIATTTTTTMVVPVNVPVEVKVVDPVVTVAVALLAAGATYALLLILGRAPFARRGGR